MTMPSHDPDTSADWGGQGHTEHGPFGTTPDVGDSTTKATEPSDPLNFLPAADPSNGSTPDLSADWGYPHH